MKKLLFAGLLAVVLPLLLAAAAKAQNYYVQQSPFWNNYYAGLGAGGMNMGSVIAQQRNTEAIVNAIRATRGLPPCSIGLLGQWAGRPAC